MIGVVVSRADEASTHIGEHLLDLADWAAREDRQGETYYRTEGFELREFEDLHIHVEGAAEPFDDPDLLVFVSRHSGESGPLLTAHYTGNFGPAEAGGQPRELARACPNAHARALDSLAAHAPEGYEVGMECTHHGPTDLDVPSMFVEVGSGEAEWRDPDAARAVARSVLDLRGVEPDRERVLVGFGGNHYAPRFTRIARETDWAVGHVAADWSIEAMGEDRAVLRQVFERSPASRAVLDGEHPDLAAAIEGLGYRVVSETWVREVEGVDLDLAARVEGALSAVDAGVRFGDRTDAGEFEVHAPDPDLLLDVHGIDADRAREVVAAHAVAYETEENGNRIAGRVAVPDPDAYDALIGGLASLLGEKYDAVEREGRELVAHEAAFDPEKALEAGVPEGPAFGRLAAGEAVEVDGETVEPESVHTERTRRYRIDGLAGGPEP